MFGFDEEILDHRRNRGPARDPIALHAFRGDDAVPTRQQNHGIAVVEGAVHAALHAGHVKEGRDREHRQFGLHREPAHRGHERMHGRAVRMHAGPGLAGGAGGVRHHAQVVGTCAQGSRRQAARERIAPQRDTGPRKLDARRRNELRHGEVGGLFQIIRICGDDHMLEFPRIEQRFDARVQLLRDDRSRGSCVLGAAKKFLREVHWIERHDDRIGAQDAVIGDDELRAVLHVEQHAIALAHTAALLEIARDPLRFVVNLGKADRRVVIDETGFGRIAPCGHLEVVEHVGGRRVQVLPRMIRPEFEVPIRHGALSG